MSVNNENVSSSSKLTTSKRQLENQLRLAQLRIKKLELEAEAFRKIDEVDREYNKVKDELDSINSDASGSSGFALPTKSLDKAEVVRSYVNSLPVIINPSNESLPLQQPDVPVLNPSQLGEFAQVLNACMSLPVRCLKKFNGDPSNYYSFIQGFKTTVARYTSDPANLLSYLICYCEDEALEAVQRCTIMEPSEGYHEALRILERRFGEPHVVARKYIEEITDGPIIRSEDHKSLMKLSETMKMCSVTLKSMRFESDLNACRTLGAVVQRLPNSIQSKWFEVASGILKCKREPTFDDLTMFVSRKADAAATKLMYVTNYRPESRNTREAQKHVTQDHSKKFASTLMTSATAVKEKTPLVCIHCNEMHYLDDCKKFRQLSCPERRAYVERHRLCYLCLKPNHMSKSCRSRWSCSWKGCLGKHHPLLHKVTSDPVNKTAEPGNNVESATTGTVNHNNNSGAGWVVSLAVLPVRLRGPQGEMIVNALLDTGSDTTLVHNSVLSQLGLVGSPTQLSLSTVNDEKKLNTISVSFDIENIGSKEVITVKRALAVSTLPKLNPLPPASQLKAWSHLSEVPFRKPCDQNIQLLIGCDVPKAHWVLEQRTGAPDEPYAVKGPLGWVLLGPIMANTVCKARLNYLSESKDLNARLESFFNFEFSETPCLKKAMSLDDAIAISHMKASMKFSDGHFEVALPWKDGAPYFPNARPMAHKRLCSLRNRFEKDPVFKSLYVEKMTEYIRNGYAEVVPNSDLWKSGGPVWFLPHHGVFKQSDSSKLRVVFDCAAKVAGTSLNSQLLSGPDLVNSLCGVLLRFRQHPYVFIADIEAMFHQVGLPLSDRDALRFLWWPNGDTSLKPITYRMKVHPFGATSSPSCASFALQQTIEYHMSGYGINDTQQARRCFYVDDCLLSLSNESELRDFTLRMREAISKGGFNLTKLFSNSKHVQTSFLSLNDAPNLKLDRQPDEIRRTLGVEWDSKNDCFVFKVEQWQGVLTRRSLLSYVASLYDPMGFVAPLLLPAKCLIQDLCRRNAKWDDPLNDDEAQLWMKWLRTMNFLEHISLPRCVYPEKFGSSCRAELHGFSDASEIGYGAALYLRLIDFNNNICCSLLLGKSRVAPIKSTSIPRLELAAAVVCVKLAAFAKEELSIEISSTKLWTDSMIVLQLIRNKTTRFETFIANRLSVIHDFSATKDWFYVESKLNPADLASRGMNPSETVNRVWFHGPDYLWKSADQWPTQPLYSDAKTQLMKPIAEAVVNTTTVSTSWFDIFAGTGTWISLLRKVAWLRRFCLWFTKRGVLHHSSLATERLLTTAEIKCAGEHILRLAQLSRFKSEIDSLSTKQNREGLSVSQRSRLKKLHPFLHEGLLRVGGRLRWAPVPFDSKHPIIVPNDHFVSDLIIRYYHELNGHIGTLQVLSAVRERYWVIDGHSAVRKVLRNCLSCRYWHSQPGKQIMAPLPEDRMHTNENPFSIVGVDYFGPLLVKRGRGTDKRYGCVFSCLTMRAVHLEIVHSLETDSFLCALSRFVARRGCPTRIYSDNGTNFRGAEGEIRKNLKLLDQKKVSDALLQRGCDWVFTPPKASHRGGIWERMIRSIRRIMRSMLGEQLVSDEVLMTTMTEIENILNNRPLTKLSDDPEDIAALTPNHLLLLKGNDVEVSVCHENPLIRKWKQAQHLGDVFWSRWLREYLPLLQARQKWHRVCRNLRAGDLVLLTDNARRGLWPKGVIQQPIVGRDGQVREAWVRTPTGIFKRDVRQLCLLEGTKTDDDGQSSNPVGECKLRP